MTGQESENLLKPIDQINFSQVTTILILVIGNLSEALVVSRGCERKISADPRELIAKGLVQSSVLLFNLMTIFYNGASAIEKEVNEIRSILMGDKDVK